MEIRLRWRWWMEVKADRQHFLLIWRSCVAAWQCWSWERSCWSHWLWRTWSPWSHSFWTKKRHNGLVLVWYLSCSMNFKLHQRVDFLFSYRTGIAGFFLPKFASKMKPSNAMNRNWAKVTMLPHPGNSLEDTSDRNQARKEVNTPINNHQCWWKSIRYDSGTECSRTRQCVKSFILIMFS